MGIGISKLLVPRRTSDLHERVHHCSRRTELRRLSPNAGWISSCGVAVTSTVRRTFCSLATGLLCGSTAAADGGCPCGGAALTSLLHRRRGGRGDLPCAAAFDIDHACTRCAARCLLAARSHALRRAHLHLNAAAND